LHATNGSDDSLDNGETHNDNDAHEDLVAFIQSITDILDEATNNIYAFLEAFDGGNVSLPTETHSLWDTDPDVEDIHPDYLQAMTDLQDVAIDDIYEFIEAIDGGNVTDQHPSGSRTPFAQVVDPSCFADRLYRHHPSHGETMDCLFYLNEPMPIVAPSRHADKMYWHWHSHAYLLLGLRICMTIPVV
jgi:hypothetical protein